MVSASELSWRHAWLESGDGGVCGLHAGPNGVMDRLSAFEGELGCRGAPGLHGFLEEALRGLEGVLSSAGRRLERLRIQSGRQQGSQAGAAMPAASQSALAPGSQHCVLLDFAASCGATEIHTMVSRDPFVAEQDSALRKEAAARGISIVLHDACYLVHPHRLCAASAAMEGGAVAAAPSPAAAGGSSSGAASEEEPWAWRGRASQKELADCRSSSFLPPHLLSFDVFSRGLRVNAEAVTAARSGAAPRPSAESAEGVAAAGSSPAALLASALTAFPSAALMFERSSAMASGVVPSPLSAGGAQEGRLLGLTAATEGLCAQLCTQRGAGVFGIDESAAASAAAVAAAEGRLVSPMECLLLLCAMHVRGHCFDTSTMPPASSRSLYTRLCGAPPVPQALLAAGLVQPRQLWAACKSLVRGIAALVGPEDAAAAAAATAFSASPIATAEGSAFPAPSSPTPGELAKLRFTLDYSQRLLRWITVREHASHILYFRPSLAFAPARPELAVLPWATLPSNPPMPRSTSPGRLPVPSRRPSSSTAASSASSPSQLPGGGGSAQAAWWTSTGMVAAAVSALPTLPSIELPVVLLPSELPVVPSLESLSKIAQTSGIPGVESPETTLARQLREGYEAAVSPAAAVHSFALARTGWPLVDAGIRCLRATGYLPPVLLPMLAAVWCKHYGRPWHELARWCAGLSMDGSDPPLCALRWQWSAGFGAGPQASPGGWLQPVDAPDILSGFAAADWPPLAMPPAAMSQAAEAAAAAAAAWPQGSVSPSFCETTQCLPADEVSLLLRFHPCLPPHPHALAHPSGNEWAGEPDPCGGFVRTWLCSTEAGSSSSASASSSAGSPSSPLFPPLLSHRLPDAFIHEPNNAPPWLLTALGQQLFPPLGAGGLEGQDGRARGLAPNAGAGAGGGSTTSSSAAAAGSAPFSPAPLLCPFSPLSPSSTLAYTTPLVPLHVVRERSLDAVMAARELFMRRRQGSLSFFPAAVWATSQASSYALHMRSLAAQTVAYAGAHFNAALSTPSVTHLQQQQQQLQQQQQQQQAAAAAAAAAAKAAPVSTFSSWFGGGGAAATTKSSATEAAAALAAASEGRSAAAISFKERRKEARRASAGRGSRGRSSTVSTIASESAIALGASAAAGDAAAAAAAAAAASSEGMAALDAAASAFVRCQQASGYDREWGVTTQGVEVNGSSSSSSSSSSPGTSADAALRAPSGTPWPVLVEEDSAVFLRTLTSRPEDGYSEVLHDPGRRLKMLMGPGTSVRSALSNAVVGRDAAGGEWDIDCDVEACYNAVGDLDNYGDWDYTWQSLESLGHIDCHNRVCYMVSDAPPMPYSFVITQRDFCTTRMTLRLPGCRSGLVIYRNAASGMAPLWPALIRGELNGAIGFSMTPMSSRRFLALEGGGRGVEGEALAGPFARPLLVATQPSGQQLTAPTSLKGAAAAAGAATASRHAPGPLISIIPPVSWVGQTHVFTTAKADPKGTIPAYLINFVA